MVYTEYEGCVVALLLSLRSLFGLLTKDGWRDV